MHLKLQHTLTLLLLSFTTLAYLAERCYGASVKFVPELKRAESNYKWFKIDKKNSHEEKAQDTPLLHSQYDEQDPRMNDENVSLPLALKMLYEKRGMFDLGTGRGYSGFQAMRGNLGLAFASPGSHGKRK